MPSGGKRPGAGRPLGRRDTATVEQRGSIEELARAHAPEAIKALVAIATDGSSESARVTASIAILDRGFGRPYQRTEVNDLENDLAAHAARNSADPRIVDDIEAVKRARKLFVVGGVIETTDSNG